MESLPCGGNPPLVQRPLGESSRVPCGRAALTRTWHGGRGCGGGCLGGSLSVHTVWCCRCLIMIMNWSTMVILSQLCISDTTRDRPWMDHPSEHCAARM